MPPTILVRAANQRSVPTAAAGATPNSSTRIGVISAPPPTPVMPTIAPTPKPASVFRPSIGRSPRAGARLAPSGAHSISPSSRIRAITRSAAASTLEATVSIRISGASGAS